MVYQIEGGRVILLKADGETVDDPFATFSEWDGEADRTAYAEL